MNAWPPPNPVFQDLVAWYHSTHCHVSHMDMCGWDYEFSPGRDPQKMWSRIWFTKRTLLWLSSPDQPYDVVIERHIRALWKAGLLTPEALRR